MRGGESTPPTPRAPLKTSTVAPIHYATFPPLKGTPEQFIQALGATPTKVIVMAPGEVREF